jgi:hypothetical protein
MKWIIRSLLVVAVAALILPACDNFKQVSTEVSVDTGDLLEFKLDVNAALQQVLGNTVLFTDPTTGKEYTYADLPDDLSTLPFQVKFDATIPLPIVPMDPSLFAKVKPYCGSTVPYCERLYGTMINSITYTFVSNSFPVTLRQSLLVITDSIGAVTDWSKTNVNAVGVAFIPEVTPAITDGTVIQGEFAPGGQYAASDLIRTLAFNFGFAVADANGNYTQSGIHIVFDSTDPAMSKKPKGVLDLKIRVVMTFRVAPLA